MEKNVQLLLAFLLGIVRPTKIQNALIKIHVEYLATVPLTNARYYLNFLIFG